jgi:outer membrane lipoprotein-sorting protein
MRIFSRTPVLRWLAPLIASVVLLGGGWTISQITASAQEGLKPRTPAQLLVDVQHAHLAGLSGTIVQRSDLGIPSIPGAGGSGSSDLTSLVSGRHTLRVWFSGPDKARLALLGTFGESDVVMNGHDLWTWSSHDKAATHMVRPDTAETGDLTRPGNLPTTPQAAAEAALKAVDGTTKVDSTGTAMVAGRRAYELVLQPRDADSLIGQVRIAIDGATHVPLRVQVLAKGSDRPSFEVAFTHFDPTRPDAAQFRFNPPPGTTVMNQEMSKPASPEPDRFAPKHRSGEAAPQVTGEAWTTVVVADVPGGPGDRPAQVPAQLSQLMNELPKVSGSWGSGRVFAGKLFSIVLTDDGRVAVGAVRPQLLYDALAAR